MEKNHVVIDLDTFSKLQKKADKFDDTVNNRIILNKKAFKLEENYSGEKVILKIDTDEAMGIIEELSEESSIVNGFKLEGTSSNTVAIGEYELYFSKESEEKEDA